MMARITIELLGADSAYRHQINQVESRLFTFPDGLRRHIALKAWYWLSYDRLLAEYGFPEEEFTSIVYELSTKRMHPADTRFELELREDFAGAIRQGIWGHEEDVSGIANGNAICVPGSSNESR